MTFKLSSTTISLIIASVGAITGITSLLWHILNSRSKVILDRINFTRDHKRDRSKTEAIECKFIIKNKGNRSTTIENIILLIGNRFIDVTDMVRNRHIDANSSKVFEVFQDFKAEDFKGILEDKKVKLGLLVIHTFGKNKKVGYTDFRTDWLNL